MTVRNFYLYQRKSTDYKLCYREVVDRIGNIYLPKPMAKRMGLGEQILVQLAGSKSEFKGADGYITEMYPKKETPKKIRFNENTREKGELGVIYVSKEVLEDMGLSDCEIAVRITSHEEETGGSEAIAGNTAT
jgi:hypothetical protein